MKPEENEPDQPWRGRPFFFLKIFGLLLAGLVAVSFLAGPALPPPPPHGWHWGPGPRPEGPWHFFLMHVWRIWVWTLLPLLAAAFLLALILRLRADRAWRTASRQSSPPWVGRHSLFSRIFGLFLLLLAVSILLAFIHPLLHLRVEVFQRCLRFPGPVLFFLGRILILLLLGFLALSWIFRPLRWLMRGVWEISNGNLDFQFPSGARGEVGYLADQFNRMVRRVREMVESKARLVRDVSHELRSPLARVKVAVEMMPRGALKSSVMQDIAEMEIMLTEILEGEQLRNSNGGLRMEKVALSALARETVAKYQGRRPGLRLKARAPRLVLRADPARLRTVLGNVAENALKYSRGSRKPVEMELRREEGRAVVEIRDHGVGVPEAEQEKVFEPFYRVDQSRAKKTGGYGLGLSLCREIMRAHGGEISLRSRPGQGTTVRLEFPMTPR